MTPPIQPRSGHLTLVSDIVRKNGKPYYVVICDCSTPSRIRSMLIPKSVWETGDRRPQTCSKCAMPRRRAAFKVDVMHRAPIVPFYDAERGR